MKIPIIINAVFILLGITIEVDNPQFGICIATDQICLPNQPEVCLKNGDKIEYYKNQCEACKNKDQMTKFRLIRNQQDRILCSK